MFREPGKVWAHPDLRSGQRRTPAVARGPPGLVRGAGDKGDEKAAPRRLGGTRCTLLPRLPTL